MLGDLGIDKFAAVRHKALKRTGLILAHEARIARHIDGKDGSKPAFHGSFPWTTRVPAKERGIHASDNAPIMAPPGSVHEREARPYRREPDLVRGITGSAEFDPKRPWPTHGVVR